LTARSYRGPLPAFLPLTDIRPSLQSLSFGDSRDGTLANSFLLVPGRD
jgi:hypothetical protein